MQNPCHDMASSQQGNVTNVTSFEVSKAIYTSGLLKKIKLSPTTKLVLIALSNHYNPNKKDMFPSIMYLANQLGISHSSVARAITELKNNGLIIYTTAKVNHYKFTNLFFNILNVKPCQNESSNHVKKTCKQITEQKNNKQYFSKNKFNKISNLSQYRNETTKRPYYSSSSTQPCNLQHSLRNKQRENFNHINGVNYMPYKATELIRDDRTPMNNKETALKFISSFDSEDLKNPFIKKQVSRIKQIWSL